MSDLSDTTTPEPGSSPEIGAPRPKSSPRHGGRLLAVSGGNVAGLLLGVVSGIVASRVLGPDLRGEFVAALTLAGTAGVLLTLGVAQAVVTYRGEDRQLTGTLLLQAAVALIFGGGMFVVLSATGQPWLTTPGVVGGAALTTSALVTATNSGYAQRKGRMAVAFQSVRLLPQGAGVVAVVVLWLAGSRDPNQWLLTVGLALLIPAVLLMGSLLGGLRGIRQVDRVRPPPELLRRAGSAFVVVVGAQLIYRLDSLLIAVYLPASKVALYAVAVAAAGACGSVGWAVGMLTFSRLRGIDDSQTQRVIIRQGTVRAVAVTAAVAIPVAAAAPWAIQILYGSAFVPASGATRLLVLAAIPLAADYLLVHALLSLSAGRSALRAQLVAAIFTIGLLAAAISNGNLNAIALVSFAAYSLSATLLFVAALRRTSPAEAHG